jgi:hypothetical protein
MQISVAAGRAVDALAVYFKDGQVRPITMKRVNRDTSNEPLKKTSLNRAL